MTNLLSIVILSLTLVSCAETQHGYWGPSEAAPRSMLTALHTGGLDTEFATVDTRKLDPTHEPPKQISLYPGPHKIVLDTTALTPYHSLAKTQVELDFDSVPGVDYFISGDLEATNANIWLTDSRGQIVIYRMPVPYGT